MQAAFLSVQLPQLDAWTNERRRIAEFFNKNLSKVFLSFETYLFM
jgi:dTDP-4-amino-4,6-dideoxygalactose transaminase